MNVWTDSPVTFFLMVVWCVFVGFITMVYKNQKAEKANNLDCVNCQKRVSKFATICPYCGNHPKSKPAENLKDIAITLPQKAGANQRMCVRCLVPFEKGSLFCSTCGNPLT